MQPALLSIPPVGVIKPDELLTISALKSRMAFSDSAVRSMRRAGLKVRRVGKRHFVLGSDVIEHIREKSTIVE
jgi:hypothetical protein